MYPVGHAIFEIPYVFCQSTEKRLRRDKFLKIMKIVIFENFHLWSKFRAVAQVLVEARNTRLHTTAWGADVSKIVFAQFQNGF